MSTAAGESTSEPLWPTAPKQAGPSCPRCSPPRAFGPRTSNVQHCSHCRGQLLDGPDAAALLKSLGVDVDMAQSIMAEVGAPSIGCPLCPAKMHKGPVRGSTIDLCRACGAVWLDEGELSPSTLA